MKLVDIETLQRNLNFWPQKPWPKSMPCLALNGELLCGFERKQGQAIEVSEPLSEIFSQLYPTLKLSELARAFQRLKPLLSTEEMSLLLNTYDLRNSHRTEKFFLLFERMNPEFLNWCDLKAPGVNDLAILLCFEDLTPLDGVTQKIATDHLSKSQGVLALELAGELILSGLMQEITNSLSLKSTSAWLTQLKRLRYPITTEKSNKKEKRLNHIPWPKGTTAQWIRNGDQDCIELRVRALGAKELSQQLEVLKSLSEKQLGDWL